MPQAIDLQLTKRQADCITTAIFSVIAGDSDIIAIKTLIDLADILNGRRKPEEMLQYDGDDYCEYYVN